MGRPKDQELVSVFQVHQAAFKKLQVMAVEDCRVVSYLTDDSLKDGVLSDSRRAEYRLLRGEIRPGLKIGIGLHQVTFHFASGMGNKGISSSWEEGITYISDGYEKGCRIVDDLDHLDVANSNGTYLVPIERNWYLAFSQMN
jgi:hypothetical protein